MPWVTHMLAAVQTRRWSQCCWVYETVFAFQLFLYFADFCDNCVTYFSGRVHLPSTWSRGTLTYSSSSTAGRTPVLKSIVLETCSWVCGSQICLWDVSKVMKIGLWCVRTSVPDYLKSGEKSLRRSMNGEWRIFRAVLAAVTGGILCEFG